MGRALWRTLIAALYLFLLAPIIVVLIVSFDTSPYLVFPPTGFSFGSYRQVFSNEGFLNGFRVSLVVGAVVAVLATAIGTMASLALVRGRFRGRGAMNAVFLSPLLVPHVVLALSLLLLFSPLALTDTYLGLTLSHLGIAIPYTIRTVSASLATADTGCEEAARVLGAGPFTTFRRVTLPLIRPGLVAGLVTSFLISFDEAVISLFVAGNRVSPLPVQVLQYVQYRTDPQVAALSVYLILLSVLVVIVVERSLGLRRTLR
ncbi:ABC transporter permease [Actinomadura vinacea]|uniref:ABC transporter permease n=1 Tax=Actinomadura vinacea TaxID=115336 RepID=A0ABP5XIY7_9ACTN